jgi:anti-sigma factor ChrR (cupin superfamily)
MRYHVPERLNHDRREPVIVDANALPWTPSPMPGVERRFLEREGGEIARATSIVRYAAGSKFSPHVHEKGEEYLVLEGTFSDEQGDFADGTYVRNPPGSRHAPFTKEGCVIFVKLRQMAPSDRSAMVVRTRNADTIRTEIRGLSRIPLHRGHQEEVAIEILEPGTAWPDRESLSGEEILVLEGTLLYGDAVCVPGTWLRFPAGRERSLSSTTGCRLWTKRRHLG